jgi:hypothetical protein
MKLEDLLESLEKAAEVKEQPATDDKPQISKELDQLLTKEAAQNNVSEAMQMGEKLAASILEKLATQAVEEATKVEVPAKDAKDAAPGAETVEKTAEKKEEVKVDAKSTETKEVEKVAEAKPSEAKEDTNEEDMNKQAQDAGKELAQAILEKLAAEWNDRPTGPGKIQQDHAKSMAQDDAKVGPTPGRNGTLAQLFDSIVAKAKQVSSPVSYDQVAAGDSQSAAEAKDKAMGTAAIPASADVTDNVKVAQEKQAAVSALIEAGCDWDTAVDLVKSAAAEIEKEEVSHVKMAAVEHLVKEGMDFDTAVEAVQAAVSEVAAEQGK